MKSRHPAIRTLLRQHTDGLTAKQLANEMACHEDAANNALKAMPDAYIDRWSGPLRGQYAAVWCVVIPPPHCPYPKKTD